MSPMDGCRPTSPVSWTATGGGPAKRGCPGPRATRAGEEALLDAVEGALELGLEWLTVFAFSTENWRRPTDEVRYLMGFNASTCSSAGATNCTTRASGSASPAGATGGCRERVLRRMDESAELTRHNRAMTLTMAFNYGGRAEIVDAVRALVAEGVPASQVDERAIRAHLYFPDMPDPDLVIRTSGEYRISNFLLWQLAYRELVFTDVLWPDFRREHLFEAVAEYQRRERRYGGVTGMSGRPPGRRPGRGGRADRAGRGRLSPGPPPVLVTRGGPGGHDRPRRRRGRSAHGQRPAGGRGPAGGGPRAGPHRPRCRPGRREADGATADP